MTAEGHPARVLAEAEDGLAARLSLTRLVPHALGLFQLGLLVLVIRAFHLESRAFLQLTVLAFAGFAVHPLLPLRWRLPCFGCLSLGGIGLVLGPTNGAWLVGTGLVLIAAAHLPLPFAARALGVLALGAALWALRAAWVEAPLAFPAVLWPLLGSMFMFRMIVYLFDLRDGEAPFSLWRAISYFFLLPNVCFPLFPVVDYTTFCRTYQVEDEQRGAQTGIEWMLRGCLHLLLYRLVYQNLTLDPADVVSGGQVVQLALGAFLLYLRVSGSFHLAVGMLRLFGFHLPPTNHNYLLASNFTDHWRRINIYWKDFILKQFFNPLYFPLRKRVGERAAIVAATACAFFVTWLLHACQFFWIRGVFTVRPQDAVFWGFLGVIVCVNMLVELRHGRRRSLRKVKRTLGQDVRLGLATAGTLATILLAWTVWNAESVAELRLVLSKLGHWTAREALLVLGGFAALAVAAPLLARTRLEQPAAARSEAPLRGLGGMATVCVVSMLLLAVARAPDALAFQPTLAALADDLVNTELNRRDSKRLERGYYEDVGDANRIDEELASLYSGRPANWLGDKPSVRETGGFPPYELIPSNRVYYKGAMEGTNQYGMRDREYTLPKPPATYRLALLGASHTKGTGVEDLETYENLTEDRLNAEAPTGVRYEILNFSVGGYGPLSRLATLRSKVLAFHPDAVILEGVDDFTWVANEVSKAAQEGYAIPFPEVVEIARQAGVEPGVSRIVAESRIRPHARELVRWVYREFARTCREAGALPLVAILPRPEKIEGEVELMAEEVAIAREAGFTVLPMEGVYGGVPDVQALWIRPFDRHPNAVGHRMVSDRLTENLRRVLPVAAAPGPRGEKGGG